MPNYEYACKSCGDHLEVVQSFKDDPLTECPSCGGILRKLISPIGISFRGTGFYRTDSHRVGAKTIKPGESGGSESSGSGSSESPAGEKADRASGGSGSSGTKSKPATSASDTSSKKSSATAS